jgi:hypothetical protein
MATEAVTNRKIEAALSVLRHVGLAVPAFRSLSYPLGMAFPFGHHTLLARVNTRLASGLARGCLILKARHRLPASPR